MSVPYSGGGYGYQPPVPGYGGLPGRVNWGWFSESFNIFSRASGIWIGAVLIYSAIYLTVAFVLGALFPDTKAAASPSGLNDDRGISDTGSAIFMLICWIVVSFQSAGFYRVAVKQVRGEPVVFADMFSGAPYFGNMLLLWLIAGLMTTAGVFLFCVGMFVAAAFLLPSAAIVADGEGALPAISRSMGAMKQDWLMASLFAFVWYLLIAVSGLPCGLGYLVTMPMACITSALAYRDMGNMPGISMQAVTFAQPTPGTWPPAPGQSSPYGQQPGYGQAQSPYGQPQTPPFGNVPQAPVGQEPPVIPPYGTSQSPYGNDPPPKN